MQIMYSYNIKTSKLSLTFDILNYIFMILFCLTTLYPFLFLAVLSLGENASFAVFDFDMLRDRITFDNYKKVLGNQYIGWGYLSTILRVGIGTPLTLAASLFCAYPLSKKYYPHRKFWTGFIVFTMFFKGGLIPTYMLVRDLGLINSIWALLLPVLINTFSMIIMRNYLMTIPEELEESARMDGANDFIILARIIIPVAMPIIATISLWTAVWHWNAWFDSMIYIRDAKKQVLQIVLRTIVLEGTNELLDFDSGRGGYTNPYSVKAATVMVATLPIIMVYPFIQKYFVKGIMIGSLKG